MKVPVMENSSFPLKIKLYWWIEFLRLFPSNLARLFFGLQKTSFFTLCYFIVHRSDICRNVPKHQTELQYHNWFEKFPQSGIRWDFPSSVDCWAVFNIEHHRVWLIYSVNQIILGQMVISYMLNYMLEVTPFTIWVLVNN